MLWIVTGYSSKMDGLLYIVEAENEEDAYREVGKINGTRLVSVEIEESTRHALINNKDDISDEEVKDYLFHSEPRWFWEVWASEFAQGTNLREAVCW